MKRLIYILGTIIILMSSCSKEEISVENASCTPFGLGDDHPNALDYQTILDDFIALGYPGVSATISDKNGLWLGTAGKADIKNDIPMQTCHVSHSGSFAKMYTATAALILHEHGELNLDDKIDLHLPQAVSDGLPNGQTATIRQLMNHSAGMPDHDDDDELSKYGDKNDQHLPSAIGQLEYLYDDAPRFPAGTNSQYSSAHTLTLFLVLDSIYGEHHSHIISKEIINKLNLSETYYKNELNYPTPSNLTKGYYRTNENVTQEAINYAGDSQGDAGVIASSHDYYLFLRAIMEGQILNRNTLDEMLTPLWWAELSGQGIGVGLGPFIMKNNGIVQKIGHGGITLGGMTHVYFYPEKDAYISILTNTITADEPELYMEWSGNFIPNATGTSIIDRFEQIILEL